MRISKGFSAFLDAARWLAALAVLAGHLRQLVFLSLPERGAGEALGWQGFYFLTGFGHQAVLIFFVLSGFLIGGSVLQELGNGTFQWRQYLIKRVARIYPVFLLALVCGFVLDRVGLAYFNGSGVYTGSPVYPILSLGADASANLGWGTLAGNLLMLQTIVVPPLGTNGPLWSLCNEFWYYLLFPLGAALLTRGQGWGLRALQALALAMLLVLLPWQILLYFLIWLMGVLAATARRLSVPAALAGLASVAALGCSRLWPSEGTDFLIGVCFTLLVWSARDRWQAVPRGARVHKFFADFSYSLYAFHFPFLIFVGAVLHDTEGCGIDMRPGWQAGSLYVVLLAAAFLYSYVLSLVCERQTPRVRNMLFLLCRCERVRIKAQEPESSEVPEIPLEKASACTPG